MTVGRILLWGLAGLTAVGMLAALLLYLDYQRWAAAPLHGDAEPHTFVLERGATMRTVANHLEHEGLLERPLYLRLHGRLSGEAERLQSGEYRIPSGMTAPELVTRLARGRVVQHRFTIVEGWTFQQLLAALEADPRIVDTLDGVDAETIMAELGSEGEHPEGWFYPETYSFTRGTTDRDILRRSHRAMQERLEAVWAQRVEDLPLESAYEALILASIIERETGAAHERREIAGVFKRRLEQGMRLQTDPTVIYGMGDDYDGRIRTRDLRTDTPYNTYTRHGLTPTPIAMPGGAALEAAVDPKPGEYLYFVSRGDGTHQFSRTLDEHNAAVRRYILGQGDGEE